MPRKMYLEDIPLEEARRRFEAALDRASVGRLSAETLPVDEALGRVTAGPVWARISSPHYHGAAMDGIAVRAEETVGASETNPLRLTVGMQATWVDTGDPLPPDANAVIMVEHVQTIDDATLEIMAPVAPWQHVRAMGEDIVATELVVPEGHLLTPVDLGAVVAAGLSEVAVRRRPRIAVLATGSELVEPGTPLKPGDIVEFNSRMLCAQLTEWGAAPDRQPITRDDFDLLKSRVETALESHDVIVVNAGSSAGSEDFTSQVVQALGELLVHGVAIRPGHPVILGLARGKPVIGIPGYPVSAVLTNDLFVRPLVCRLLGLALPERPRVQAVVSRKVLSPIGEDEFVRVKLGRVGDRLIATPLSRGAGVIMSLVRADGILTIPRLSEGLHAGAEVDVELLRRREEVERTIVAIGSHDLTLDLLSSRLATVKPGFSLASSNVGSLGGLIALQRNEAHLAGSHLLDDTTGEYNLSYVRRHLPGRPVVVVRLVGRDQGLIVPPGNPRGVGSLDDLLGGRLRFVNRQKGSGTRVLLDYELQRRGADPASIQGYEREEYTHLAVAAAVAGGVADVGLGILAAARALGLEFVPLLEEQYELVVPREHYESELLRPLLDIVRSQDFRGEVLALGGYHVERMGEVVAEL
ncbi:MAG: molybdopterin biosynthesis protein [Chloroflexi bacterium]|nr:molybdopterin biosynthesis protein [Chloroflexota bacterium]